MNRIFNIKNCLKTRFKLHSNRSFSSDGHSDQLEPLCFALDEDMRRHCNQAWYWNNRNTFVENPELFHKFVLFDNTKVVQVFHHWNDACSYQADHLHCFLTFVGDEDYPQGYAARGPSQDDEDLFQQGDILTPHVLPRVPAGEFQGKHVFYGLSGRPYVLLGLQHAGCPTEVVPAWFLLETGVPRTCITDATCQALFGIVKVRSDFLISIVGHPRPVVTRTGQSKYLNVLGTDVSWEYSLKINRAKNILSMSLE
eukprot:TRINITY_DN25019_c0_g1_i1.p1 TRINITY_DN25019_c0_g1~~TRINITY_DN25019_c0_g1_i1.p1  ORF type:complete len:254 (+),score=11.72 TRINITY_DN25019_c0_g1_i1:2-763(+)